MRTALCSLGLVCVHSRVCVSVHSQDGDWVLSPGAAGVSDDMEEEVVTAREDDSDSDGVILLVQHNNKPGILELIPPCPQP